MNKAIDTHAVFLPGPSGPLFALHLPPAVSTVSRQYLVHLPAFAEEMNRARHRVAVQARAFAERGVGVLVLDPFGTGDSAGDFADARWAAWRKDVAFAVAWLRQRGVEHVALWGLRLGCLLALDFVQRGSQRVDGLLFWQPLLDGRTAMDRFLRLRVAAEAIGGGSKETVQGLRSRLAAGESLEIGGYEISPELVHEIDCCRAASFAGPQADPVAWLEIAGAAGPAATDAGGAACLSSVSQAVVEGWRRAGCRLGVARVNAPPFWQRHTAEAMPELYSETLRLWDSLSPCAAPSGRDAG